MSRRSPRDDSEWMSNSRNYRCVLGVEQVPTPAWPNEVRFASYRCFPATLVTSVSVREELKAHRGLGIEGLKDYVSSYYNGKTEGSRDGTLPNFRKRFN